MTQSIHRSVRVLLLVAIAAAAPLACSRATVAIPGADPGPDPDVVRRQSSLSSLVLAERSFAQMSRDSGWHRAFLAHLTDSAVLYRPGPVNGVEWLRANPPRGSTAALIWEPRWAEVSSAGDLGYTTGPYELRLRGPSDTAASRGSYVTVWQRPPNGVWRALLHAGASGTSPWTLTADGWGEWEAPARDSVPTSVRSGALRDELLEADRRIGGGEEPGDRALVARLDERARLYRQGVRHVTGRDDIRRVLETAAGRYRSTPDTAIVAQSGDLAMTRGSYTLEGAGGSANEQGHYVRLWRRASDGQWWVTLDLSLPIATRRQ